MYAVKHTSSNRLHGRISSYKHRDCGGDDTLVPHSPPPAPRQDQQLSPKSPDFGVHLDFPPICSYHPDSGWHSSATQPTTSTTAKSAVLHFNFGVCPPRFSTNLPSPAPQVPSTKAGKTNLPSLTTGVENLLQLPLDLQPLLSPPLLHVRPRFRTPPGTQKELALSESQSSLAKTGMGEAWHLLRHSSEQLLPTSFALCSTPPRSSNAG